MPFYKDSLKTIIFQCLKTYILGRNPTLNHWTGGKLAVSVSQNVEPEPNRVNRQTVRRFKTASPVSVSGYEPTVNR